MKPGATVVDVGINRVTDPRLATEMFGEGSERFEGFQKRGSVLVGDVHPEVARGGGRHHARAWRRRPADDRDGDGEHAEGGGARDLVGRR